LRLQARKPRVPEEVQLLGGDPEDGRRRREDFRLSGIPDRQRNFEADQSRLSAVYEDDKNRSAATADHLKALQQFSEEMKEALALPSLYNESLGTPAIHINTIALRTATNRKSTGRSGPGDSESEGSRGHEEGISVGRLRLRLSAVSSE